MLSTVLALVLAATAPRIGVCDPVDGPPLEWSADQRAEVRARVRSACKALGAAPMVCTWLDASGIRESSWSPSVRHTLGRGEAGLGVLGLSTHWQRDKWPGRDEDPAFCSPEVSAIVALAIVHRAQTVWEARDLRDVQAVFAGRFRCVTEGEERNCFIVRDVTADADICRRLELHGVDCRAPLRKRAGGRRVPLRDRPKAAEALAERWAKKPAA